MTKSSAKMHFVPDPDEFPDVRVTAAMRLDIARSAFECAEVLNVDELMFFAAALEHEAQKKREGGTS